MKNPLNKRLPREFRKDFGKYLVIFLLLVITIGFVSGFLVADGSLNALYENFATNKHFFSNKLKLAVSPDYIIDLNRTTNGFNVIPLDTITNVYVCNIADGKLTGTNYIALEVEFGNRITIAPHEGELTEYNYVVNNIRHFIKERHGEADA